MKILVSQEEYIKKNHIFDGLERAYYNFLAGHQLIPMPNVRKDPDVEYDCLLLTGGPDSIARHYTEDLLYKHAKDRKIPIVGICHGAFVINDLCGGTHTRIEGHVNCDIDVKLYDKIYKVKCFHTQAIKTLGDNLTATAHDMNANIHAFMHDKLPIYGIVWHPERMDKPVLPPEVSKLFD